MALVNNRPAPHEVHAPIEGGTYLGEGSKVSGKLTFEGPARIDGLDAPRSLSHPSGRLAIQAAETQLSARCIRSETHTAALRTDLTPSKFTCALPHNHV